MKNKYLNLLLALILFHFLPGYAQKGYLSGYVISNKGDTLYGTVKDRKSTPMPRLYAKIKFKNHRGKKRTLGPNDIAAYKRGGSIFQSVPFGEVEKFIRTTRVSYGEKHFLRIRVSGYLTLYEHEFIEYECGPNFDSNFYLKKTNEIHFTRIPIIGFRKRMKTYFSDSYMILKKIENKNYRYKNLVELARDYNRWYEDETL